MESRRADAHGSSTSIHPRRHSHAFNCRSLVGEARAARPRRAARGVSTRTARALRYALLAHDSGGGVARFLAADNPSVCALVLGNTEIPGHHPTQIDMLQKLARLPGGAQLVSLSMRSRLVRRSGLAFGTCFADPSHIEGEFYELFVAPMLRSPGLARRQFALVQNLDVKVMNGLRDAHARIRAPSLLIWGDRDPIFPIDKARAMLGQFTGGARLEVLAGGKCFVHEEQPEAFVALAEPFLLLAFARRDAS